MKCDFLADSKENILIKSDITIKEEEPDPGIVDPVSNDIVDYYYDQIEDWYETEADPLNTLPPKPKKSKRGRLSKIYKEGKIHAKVVLNFDLGFEKRSINIFFG